jgi:hypothetical protein
MPVALRNDNGTFGGDMRAAREACDEHDIVATTSVPENRIDDGETES